MCSFEFITGQCDVHSLCTLSVYNRNVHDTSIVGFALNIHYWIKKFILGTCVKRIQMSFGGQTSYLDGPRGE